MTEHKLIVEGRGSVYQELEHNNGYFDLTHEEVIRRRYVNSVECSCGEEFGGDITAAKEHTKNVEWEREHLSNDEEPLAVGDVINVHGDEEPTFEVRSLSGNYIELQLGDWIAPIDERDTFREQLQTTGDEDISFEIRDSDGKVKSVLAE